MNFWVLVVFILAGLIGCSVVTWLLTRLRMERVSAERARVLTDTVTRLENEKARLEESIKGIEESARRKALDEFLADLRVEERRYVREHRVLFAHRKSLVLQERIFFRNVPISNWVEHEVPVEEGADLEAVAKTLSVFDAVGSGAPLARGSRTLLFSRR
jgi:biopolymer transport protein ExbB/TolQ